MALIEQSVFWQPALHRRFLAKVKEASTGCWLWQASKDQKGYGSFSAVRNRRVGVFHNVGAHVAAYRIFVGPVPAGYVIDHLCRVPSCVNPWHLEAVSGRENIHRGQRARGVGIAVSHCPAGHPYDSSNTYRNKRKRFCRTCGNAAVRRYQQRKQR